MTLDPKEGQVLAVCLPQHPDKHGPKRPVLLAVDRAIVDQAPYLWLANQMAVEFVSERVGNYQWSLQWNALLNQLWVR